MNYAEMTDFEINKAAANAAGYKLGSDFQSLLDEFSPGCVNVIIEGSQSTFNPCNSWADAGPIIAGNFIAIVPAYEFQDESEERLKLTGRWGAESISEEAKSLVARDQNPLRAAMIVFLMMQEGE